MLPEKLHIEQIQRFHRMLKELGEKVDKETDKDKQGELAMQYYKLSKLWMEIDEFIEFVLKTKLDYFKL